MAYKNPDYDPVKAHEYYEKHKQLKGRRSTKGFTETQKAQWAYVQEQIKQDKKQQNQQLTEGAKQVRKQLSDQAKDKIKRLREALKNMSNEQKAMMKEKVKGMISKIRENLKQSKTAITNATKAERQNIRDEAEKKKDEAYNKIKGGK